MVYPIKIINYFGR